jgi:5-methylcytosine-specific restriction protein B
MSNSNLNKYPVNQILYGPPGTGKTYELKLSYFPKYTSEESSLTAEQHFKNVVSECSWWQVIAIALIQSGKCKVNDLTTNKWVIQKAELSNSKTIRPTIWGQLQSHTVESCEFVNVKSKQQPYIFNKTNDSLWEIVDEEVKEKTPELYEIIDSVENFNPSSDKLFERYVFTTFHQSYSYEDFIEGIKPILTNEESDGAVAYQIEDGIFKQICKKAEIDPENQYAIFIDEINRGNVSAIFGELITLIEQDKRKGSENEMSVILPYSKKSFSVPQNLDIIGTMNTADRSVEALDTALRRRFSFVEMLPNPQLLKDKQIAGINLQVLLETINERIEVLVDRDHTIGHAFFINDTTVEELRNTFANKIIPLLQEYFYGDYSKMEMVIGSAFFDKKEVSKVKFAVKSDEFDAEGKVYHIKNISDDTVMLDEDFISAIKNLIGLEE